MTNLLLSLGYLILASLYLSIVLVIAISAFKSDRLGAPYVPIKQKVINDLFEKFVTQSRGFFIDLGSGDGRVLRLAAKSGFKKAIGYELSLWPYLKAKFLNNRDTNGSIVRVMRENLFNADLSNADWIFIYLFPEIVNKLRNKIEREAKSGSKIICCSFPFKEESGFLKLIEQTRIRGISVYIYRHI